ncbi:MAG TPA: sulfite exporter TauE/SafE family protein [Gammaproteobacteria bacterium]
MFAPEWIAVFLLLGAFVGIMAGLLGIGGGGIMVPIMASVFLRNGVPADNVVHLALGTSMASMVVTTFSSFRAHHAKGGVLWPVVRAMAPGILLGTFLATFVASHLDSVYLAGFFALFMAYVSAQMFLDKKPKPSRQLAGGVGLFSAGAGIGGVSALVSIGGGSLTVPYLTWQNVGLKQAIGTSAAIGLPIALAGTLGYLVNGWSHTDPAEYVFGFVYLPAVVMVSLTSYFAAPYGVRLSHWLPVPTLKKVFAVLLLLLSLRMLLVVL